MGIEFFLLIRATQLWKVIIVKCPYVDDWKIEGKNYFWGI